MGGNVNQVPSGFTEKQWNRLDPLIQRACEKDANLKAGIANALAKGITISEINNHYRNDVVVKGLAVEKNDDGSVKVPPESTAELLGNKDNREILTEQWQAYFRERYTNNREEARHDMVRLLSHNEVKQLQNTFVDLWHTSDDTDPAKRNASMRLKMKYVNENPAKMEQMNQMAQAYIERYKDKLDDPQLITDYKQAFAPETAKTGEKSNTVDVTITKLTMDDLKALAQFKALNELPMTSAEIGMACEELAIKAIEDRNLNSGIAEYNDCQMQIEQIINENRQNPEIQKLTAEYNTNKTELQKQLNAETDPAKKVELQRQLRELNTKFNNDCDAHLPKDVQKKIHKLAEKANKAFAKANDKENEFFEKNIDKLVEVAALSQIMIEEQKLKYDKADPQFDKLPAEVQVLVTSNPTMFCEEITDPNDTREATFTDPSSGKKYIFDGEKYKKQMLAYSQAGRTSGKEQKNQEGCDYYCDIQEADQAFWGLAFGGLGDNKDTKRDVIKKAMEAAGITTEADHTTQQRIAHVLKSAGIGALSGAGAVFVSDFLNTLRNIPGTEKIFELAELTKMIPYKHHVKFDKTYGLSGDNATWEFDKTYGLSGDDATWNGSGDWKYDETVTTHHSVTDYEDGVLVGHRQWDEDIPVHGEGTVYVSGDNGHWEYDHHVHESGNNGHWDYEHRVKEEWDEYGEVENPDADRNLYEDKGTKKRGFKFEFSPMSVYGTAALGGLITGTIDGLLSMNKIKDKGLRKDAEAMRVVSQKEIRKPDKPTPPPQPPTPPEPKITSDIKIKDESTPDQSKTEENVFTVKVDVRKPETRGNRSYYQGWQTLMTAYDFKEGINDYNGLGKRFRIWFRNQYIENGNDLWELGNSKDGAKEQHFEKTLQYKDEKTGKTYNLTFDEKVFETALDYNVSKTSSGKPGKGPTSGNTRPRSTVKVTLIPGTKSYRGTMTVTIDGKTYSASATGTNAGAAESAVKNQMRATLKQQGVSDSQINTAIANAKVS